ncbi:uncharacterized protein LOC129609384 isoform X2 [Condylostylus longicornis]|uniref:uncharacterized protein LOC129609384 isoform X2 n=1 Tax=Condylostylus longicornis TaxID=2530218 RepID=UPI00244E221A|nr:uncharacterized protein LOC129609384 isoform X2 [Condylostylus longicornis]
MPLSGCLLSPTVMLREKSFTGLRRTNRQVKSEIFSSEIALPDLITRSSLQPNNDILQRTSDANNLNETPTLKSKKSSIKSHGVGIFVSKEFQKNFKLKSPLFKHRKNSSTQNPDSTNLYFNPDTINMEFLIPQPPTTSKQKNNTNSGSEQSKQSNTLKQNSHHGNGKIFFNTNGFQHLLSSSNHNNNNNNNNNNNHARNDNKNIKENHVNNQQQQQQQIHKKKGYLEAEEEHEHQHQLTHLRHDTINNDSKGLTILQNFEYEKALRKQNLQLLQQKLQLNNNNLQSGGCIGNGKLTKKQLKLAQAQLDKLTQINIHLHALFSAVEHGHLEKAKTILESTDVDVNSINSDGLSPLDVAVLVNNRSMTKMLLQHGATEISQFKVQETLGNHLNGLLRDAENRIQDLSGAEELPQPPYSTRASFSSIIGNSGNSVTGCTGTEADKQIGLWERRIKGLRRMLLGWDQARPPDYPSAITVDVTGSNSVSICILEPMEGSICTKFKVQWSTRADFSNIVGERVIYEWTSYQGVMGATSRISELTQGRRYFFRGACGNVKGWGLYKNSLPYSVIPSSWRDVDNRENRFAGRQRILDDLFTAVRLARPGDASELSLEKNSAIQRRNPKKKTTIKQLFSAASKFQKNLRRGIYLGCILYYEDKILVTNEDFLPVIEIDETYPSSLHHDYHWFMKVACTWDDVKSLRTDMERYSTSAVHFRTKLLSSACQMQSALCISDLGQLYHKPLRDSHGTVVISCVNSVKSPKSISVLNARWVPLNKIQKKVTALHEDNNINEILISSIADQISYHQTSTIRLTRGLYLGYLKMQSSVDQIQIVVPKKTPNVPPHTKIRDNPHISAEEWSILKGDKAIRNVVLEFHSKQNGKTEVQKLFLEALTAAVNRLFIYMNISPDDALNHRLYDIEVIELGSDVSFLVVCPPVESSCAVPGQREILLQRGDLLSLPIQAFEMIHLRTYQNSIIQKYSRLSCILELDTALANHSHREAFSKIELQTAKERLLKLQELTSSLNAVWKGVRWLMDVIGYARDKSCVPATSMKEILQHKQLDSLQENLDEDDNNIHLLQLPSRDGKLMKSSPGRGSWPGPAATNNLGNSSCYLAAEHSKSEQNLGLSRLTPGYLSINSGMTDEIGPSSRKNSADSQSGHSYFSAGETALSDHNLLTRLPPSKSEDTLVMSKRYPMGQPHRKRSTTSSITLNPGNIPITSSLHCSKVQDIPKANKVIVSKGITDSLQSLSSDSESSTYPLVMGGRIKVKAKLEKSPRETVSLLKPTLTTLQTDKNLLREPLHISEPSSPCTEQMPRKCNAKYSSTEDIAPTIISSCTISTSSATSTVTTSNIPPTIAQSSNVDIVGCSSSSSGSTNPSNSGALLTNHSGIIQVYAAYETGLAQGTSLKLHVTSKTTAKEVVDLVVKQLNMAVVLKGKEGPIYTADKLDNFCLVAVIGARERCLRDDFKPLQLQNPWKKGKLYVRQKHDLLAAIEHSNRETHLI